MQDTDKPVNIDTSGPGAEVELDSVKEELIEETIVKKKHQERISHMKTNVKQNLKTVVAPMTQMRNLMSQLMFKLAKRIQKKRKN